jgi:hypothetical protein
MKTILLISFILISQSFAKESKIGAKADKTVEAAQELVGTTKAELKESFNENLSRLDQEVEDLKTKMRKTGKEADAELQNQLQEIESKRTQLRRKFEALNSTSQGAWSDVQNGLKKAWSELSGSLKSAKGRFQETSKSP